MTHNRSENHRPRNVDDLGVAVIGAGLMGHSIAGVFAAVGARVAIHDPDEQALRAVPDRVSRQLSKLGRDARPAQEIELSRELSAAVERADLVIEAAPEQLSLKQDLLARIGELRPHAVLATNTSVLRIAEITQRVQRPERVLGTHWFNPPHLVPVVEVVQAERTSDDVVSWTISVLKQAGKLPVHVRRDVPGFIGNRIQHAMWREAMSLVDAGICDATTVDLVVRNSFGLRLAAMGPMENADYVGLDLTLAVHEYLFPSLARNEHPSPRLRELVDEGRLGAKTGSGFREWPAGEREAAANRLENHLLAHQGVTHCGPPTAGER